MNRAMLIGRLTKEPELRATGSGISVCTFTLAVERRFKQEGQQQADFIPIVVWRAQAESCAKYLHKGSQAAVCGSVQTRSYDAPDGSKRYVTEIVADEVQFLGKSDSGDNDGAARMVSTPFREEMQSAEEDELPF